MSVVSTTDASYDSDTMVDAEEDPARSVEPSSVASLCVGDYQFSQSDMRMSTNLRLLR